MITDGYNNSLSFSSDGQNLPATKYNNTSYTTVLLWNPANGLSTAVIPYSGSGAQFSNNSPEFFDTMLPDGSPYRCTRDGLTGESELSIEQHFVFAFGFGGTGLASRIRQYNSVTHQYLCYGDFKAGVPYNCVLSENTKKDMNFSSMACGDHRISRLCLVGLPADGSSFVFTASPASESYTAALSRMGSAKVTQLVWPANDKYIVSGDSSGTIRIWNAGNLTWASKGATTNYLIGSLAFCAADMVASRGKARLYDIESASWVPDVGLPTGSDAAAFHEATLCLAVMTFSNTKIFEMKPRNQVALPINAPPRPIWSTSQLLPLFQSSSPLSTSLIKSHSCCLGLYSMAHTLTSTEVANFFLIEEEISSRL